MEAEHLNYSVDGKTIVRDFSVNLLRGDRVGILGPNGCGKSTLIRLLLGRLAPDSGTVKLGTQLQVAYFDQLRDTLNEEKSVIDNVAEGSDVVTINGQNKHVIGYLQDFLFDPSRVRQPVKSLSGGERNRLLLAKLFTNPFNLLVLDEPTNDLDAETLELLEEQLMNYQGTLLLVSHDRDFLDRVAATTIAMEGDGKATVYAGGWTDYLAQRQQDDFDQSVVVKSKPGAKSEKPKAAQQSGLSFTEKHRLEALAAEIPTIR